MAPTYLTPFPGYEKNHLKTYPRDPKLVVNMCSTQDIGFFGTSPHSGKKHLAFLWGAGEAKNSHQKIDWPKWLCCPNTCSISRKNALFSLHPPHAKFFLLIDNEVRFLTPSLFFFLRVKALLKKASDPARLIKLVVSVRAASPALKAKKLTKSFRAFYATWNPIPLNEHWMRFRQIR